MEPKPINVLLVEDDDDHAALVVRYLNRSGACAALHRAADGAEALAFLRREGAYSDVPRPDVVLLDVNLPKYNGHEVLERVRRDPDLQDLQIVMLTTSSSQLDRDKAEARNVNDYLVKPLKYEQLLHLLAALGPQ